MEDIEDFHRLLLYIIVAICIFVLALLVWIDAALQRSAPIRLPARRITTRCWKWPGPCIPVIILVVIAIPSFKLLYYEAEIPKPDVTIKAIGKQWFWTYEYPGTDGNFQFMTRIGLSRRRRRPRRTSRACWAWTIRSTCR